MSERTLRASRAIYSSSRSYVKKMYIIIAVQNNSETALFGFIHFVDIFGGIPLMNGGYAPDKHCQAIIFPAPNPLFSMKYVLMAGLAPVLHLLTMACCML